MKKGKKKKMNKIFIPMFFVALATLALVACGNPNPAPEIEKLALDVGQELDIRSLGTQSTVEHVRIVYTTKFTGDRSPVFHGQVFFDGGIVKFWHTFPTHRATLLPGLQTEANIITEQIEIFIDSDLWEVMP